jgi:translation initiation factor 2B subunit (eIF-2B alpha/beta/delta family)
VFSHGSACGLKTIRSCVIRRNWATSAEVFSLKLTLYGTATVDLGALVDRFAYGLNDELLSVIPYLAPYSNLAFKSVDVQIISPDALSNTHYIRQVWPNLLSMVCSSGSEAASMVAAIVKSTVEDRKDMPRKEIEEILNFAQTLHPHNLLIRNIASEIRTTMAKGDSNTDALVRCKNDYLKKRQSECRRVAASAKGRIDGDDWLVVYGYSHAVMTLLTEQLVGHRGTVLVVRSPCPNSGTLAPDETKRIEEKVKASGLKYRVVEMASLPGIFTRLQKQEEQIKVLLGTRGVFNGGDVLGAVGSSLVALAAKAHGGTVFVLAEEDKRAVDADTRDAMESLLRQHADSLVSPESRGQNSFQLNVPVDCLTPGTYDAIIGIDSPSSGSVAPVEQV